MSPLRGSILRPMGAAPVHISGISLPADLAEFVERQVAEGNFATESEVFRAGLCLLRERAQLRAARLEELRALVRPAIEQLDRGEGALLDVEDIKARGRQRLAQQSEPQ
jgi:antitoxin ParD1/3/4